MLKARLLLLAALGVSVPAWAQTTATAPAQGLDALSEDLVVGELANRGLGMLLERQFEVRDTPEATRKGVRTLMALRELASAPPLSQDERRQHIADIVTQINDALPGISDPRVLMQQASLLLGSGMEREVNLLEYWGDSPAVQQTLEPTADLVVRLLDKAEQEATRQSELLTQNVSDLNDPRLAQAEAMLQLATSAAYTRDMAAYNLVLALDPDDPQRKVVADKAIEGLKIFDTPASQVQAAARNRMAKLLMLSGRPDEAKELFRSVAENSDGTISPPPTRAQQYEARYFAAVTDVLDEEPAAAQQALLELERWQKQNLPQDQATQNGASAAASMLQYRIHRLNASLATTEGSRRTAQDDAVKTLIELVQRRPELQGIVYEQLMASLPPNPDLQNLDPLLLQALVREGEEERLKPEGEPVDDQVLSRATAAAREIIRRRRDPGSDPQFVETATLLIPFFLLRQDRPVEAADAFMDYIRDYPSNQKNIQLALDNALAIVAQLRTSAPSDASTMRLYERVLPVAVDPPFNRTEFAYEWARRLQRMGRAKEAAHYYQLVPDDHPQKLAAQFFEVVTLQQRLDNEQMEPAERQQVVAVLLDRAQTIRSRAAAALASSTSEDERQTNRAIIARTTLLAADVARRERTDPQRALDLLSDFESEAAGLPSERELLNGAMFARVQAYMQLDRNAEATDTLLKLLKTLPGDEGASVVLSLLQRLNTDLDQARAQNDQQRMRELALQRAALSGRLVNWAQDNENPDIRRYTYRYRVFDAAAKHLAAAMEPDPDRRRAGLEEALALFQALREPENGALYQATHDTSTADGEDPQVLLEIGLIQFDLGNYAQAQETLGPLLRDRRLGAPTTITTDNGEEMTVPNDQYWEAVYKLLRSNVALADADPAQADLRTQSAAFLKQLYIQWGPSLAGTRWADELDQLRAEIAPEFAPVDLSATTAPGTVSEPR